MRTKILALGLICPSLILFANPLSGEDRIFGLLQFSMASTIWLDTALTYEGIWNRGIREGNPIVRLYIGSPPATFAIDLATIAALIKGTDRIHKKNKKLAYSMVIGINLIQGYMLYRHYRLRC